MRWPYQDYDSMVKFYGEVGENQCSLILPYPMKLAWDLDTTVKKITCHEKVHNSLLNIFNRTLEEYGLDKIQELRLDLFGGCLNVRKMRGGNSWSVHAFGAAVDIDPDNNQMGWGKDKSTLARPEYDRFWDIVINEEKWVSLGKGRNLDYQHLQAANL